MSPAHGKRRVRVSRGELSVTDLGAPEAPAVLFVHGFPTSSFLWRAFLPSLPPAMRAIAPDLLGAGDSDKPERAPLGIEAQAGYLSELLDALGLERPAIVGHSHGGGIAQLLALGGRAGALVLIDSVELGGAGEPFRALMGAKDTIGAAFDLGMSHRDRLSPDTLLEYRRPFEGPGGAEALSRWAGALEEPPSRVSELELSRLEIPVLLLWGEDDALTPVTIADRLNDVIEGSGLALLPGCGHLLPEDAPATVGPLVYEYLRGTYAGLPHVHDAGPTVVELGRRISRE